MVTTKTTKVLRHHLSLKNGGSRYIDIDNPVDTPIAIASNINSLNGLISEEGSYSGILVGEDFFDGDTDAVVTACTSAEIIETQKIVTTTNITI